jgi:4'-phosphopantetheinyl transferase EntD
MADPFSRLIAELKKQSPLQCLRGQSSQLWGSQHLGSRAAIRGSLQSSQAWSAQDLPLISDLSSPPRPFQTSVSISHTHDMGGWLSLPRPGQIGLDIEIVARIEDRIVDRVGSPQELTETPRKALLWGAKEAFFKALEDEQPAVITNLTISDWKVQGELTTWRGLGPRNGDGVCLVAEPWLLTVCWIA